MKSEKVTAKETKAAKETRPVKDTKPAIKQEPAKAAAQREPAKAAAQKEPAKTAAQKATAKKAPAKKQEIKETVYLQFLGKELNKEDIIKKVKENWTKVLKNKVGDIKSITLYLKPEENAAYFVINGEITGSVDL